MTAAYVLTWGGLRIALSADTVRQYSARPPVDRRRPGPDLRPAEPRPAAHAGRRTVSSLDHSITRSFDDRVNTGRAGGEHRTRRNTGGAGWPGAGLGLAWGWPLSASGLAYRQKKDPDYVWTVRPQPDKDRSGNEAEREEIR